MKITLPPKINTRYESQRRTGVQRYAFEVTAACKTKPNRVTLWSPWRSVTQVMEQVFLPGLTQDKLLFSPANIGPIWKSEQVVTIHDVAFLDHPEWFSARFSAWYGTMIRELVLNVRGVITVSDFSKRRLVAQTGVNPGKVHVIPNGVTLLDRAGISRASESSERFILCVGSIEPRKNLKRLIAAWRDIDRRDTRLLIVGARGDVFSDSGIGSLPENVQMTGYLTDGELAKLYRTALGFVYVSLYEGFGLPPLEAMANGCPVLVSKASSLPETCGPAYGEKGNELPDSWFRLLEGPQHLCDVYPSSQGAALYCDPWSVGDIAAGLTRLLNLDDRTRREISLRSLKWAAQFTWEKCASSTLAVLDACGTTNVDVI